MRSATIFQCFSWKRSNPTRAAAADLAQSLIEASRQNDATEEAGVMVSEFDESEFSSAEGSVEEIEDALIELAERNPLLANAHIEVERITCEPVGAPERGVNKFAECETSEAEARRQQDDSQGADEAEQDLEDFETGLYLCRWPNGEFSLVKADDRKNALVQLDEWAGAEPAWLIPVDTCMVDFKLTDGGEIELAEFGEETEEFIWEECYPELSEVLGSDRWRH